MTKQHIARRRCTAAVTADGRLVALLFAMAASALLAKRRATAADPVEKRWESRVAFSSCGEVRLRQGEEMERQAARGIACLRRALENGTHAELQVTRPTVEGDLVHEYYRLTPRGRLEFHVDNTADRYSDGNWSSTDCHTPQWLPEVSCPDESASRSGNATEPARSGV